MVAVAAAVVEEVAEEAAGTAAMIVATAVATIVGEVLFCRCVPAAVLVLPISLPAAFAPARRLC